MGKIRKKALALFMSGIIALSGLSAADVAVYASSSVVFTDIAGLNCENAVKNLVSEGYMTGYEDGTFRPDGHITRAEVSRVVGGIIIDAVLDERNRLEAEKAAAAEQADRDAAKDRFEDERLRQIDSYYAETHPLPDENAENGVQGSRASDIEDGSDDNEIGSNVVDVTNTYAMRNLANLMFDDISGDAWAMPYIGITAYYGIMTGYGSGSFMPDNDITYNELVTVALKASSFDIKTVSGTWPQNYQDAARQLGLYTGLKEFVGYGDGTLTATRGNAAIILNNAIPHIRAAALAGYTPVEGAVDMVQIHEISLSMAEAVDMMQTSGTLAVSAKMHKNSDETLIRTSDLSIGTIARTLNNTDGYPISAILTLQESGITRDNLEIAKFQRDFVADNITDNYQAEMNSIAVTARDMYYGLLQIQENIDVLSKTLEYQKKTLEIMKVQNENDVLSDIQLAVQEHTVTSAEDSLAQAEESMAETMITFRSLLGLPADAEVTLTDTIKLTDEQLPPLMQALESMNNNNLTLKYYQYIIDISTMSLAAMEPTTYKGSSTYINAELGLDQAKTGLDLIRTNQEMSLRKTYTSLDELKSQISTFDSTIELAQKNLELTKVQYELGMATWNAVEGIELNILQAQQGRTNAIVTYNKAVSDFNYLLGVGTDRITFSSAG